MITLNKIKVKLNFIKVLMIKNWNRVLMEKIMQGLIFNRWRNFPAVEVPGSSRGRVAKR